MAEMTIPVPEAEANLPVDFIASGDKSAVKIVTISKSWSATSGASIVSYNSNIDLDILSEVPSGYRLVGYTKVTPVNLNPAPFGQAGSIGTTAQETITAKVKLVSAQASGASKATSDTYGVIATLVCIRGGLKMATAINGEGS